MDEPLLEPGAVRYRLVRRRAESGFPSPGQQRVVAVGERKRDTRGQAVRLVDAHDHLERDPRLPPAALVLAALVERADHLLDHPEAARVRLAGEEVEAERAPLLRRQRDLAPGRDRWLEAELRVVEEAALP